MEKQNLMPLKIPQGWAITYNKLMDVMPIKGKEEEIDNWEYFTEDLLQIVKLSIKNGKYFIPNQHFLIDLGWYPDSLINGEYKLVLVWLNLEAENKWEEIANFSSQDRFAIRDKLESWLASDIFNEMNNREEMIKRML